MLIIITKIITKYFYRRFIRRNPIKPNIKLLEKNIKNKITLITGAGGSIGSELCLNILKRKPKKIILFENSEYNLYKIEQN